MNVCLYGHLRAGFGLASGAQATARALEGAGCRVLPVDLALPTHPALASRSVESDPCHASTVNQIQVDLVHTNPNILASSPGLLRPEQLKAPVRIGYWAWELEQFPRGWESYFKDYQEIWCPSTYTAQSLAQRSPIPVVAVPHLLDWQRMDRIVQTRARREQGQPYTFLTLFDYWSTTERKNPLGVVEAFQRAFPYSDQNGQQVRLLIKTSSHEQFPHQAAKLRASTARDSRIHWLDGLMTERELDQLYGSVDAVVSLHRAEGFGLTIAEAMAMAIPVVATGYSGCLDFMPPGAAWQIPWLMVPITKTIGDYPRGASWADPSIPHAAEAMFTLASDRVAAVALGEQGRQAVLERLAPERISGIVRQRLGRSLLALDFLCPSSHAESSLNSVPSG